jgi:diguanylate cyclase (GGDEF)-like protein/PAS domain S-box-containing protein
MFHFNPQTVVILTLTLSMMVLGLTALASLMEIQARKRRRRAEQENNRLWSRKLSDASFDGLLIHRSGTILQMNNALLRMLGCREREWLGQHFANLARPDLIPALRTELEAPQPQVCEFTLLRADKTEVPVEICSHTIEHERLPATVTAIRDVSQRQADAAKIAKLSHYDPLTGLANRRLFFDRLVKAIAENDRTGGTTAVLSIDLDQFKSVNDQLGRSGGDQLLRQVAARIGALIAEADTLGRLSGDKFGVVMPSAGVPNRAMHFATQLEAAFNEPFIIDGQLMKASASIGIAIYPDHAADADGLLKASDFALKQAGRAGGGFSHMFSHEEANGFRAAAGRDLFRVGLTEPQRLAQDLRNALSNGEISLVYQPIFRAADLMLIGFEALARWNHKTDGLIPPNVFIPLAEQAGLIHEIGSFVLETACTEAAVQAPKLKMAVNLSPLQFRDLHLPSRITAILRKTGLQPAQLELEVTESLLIENSAAASQALLALKAIGVSVALDDFGTGYSSLSYLCDYPFARLKIDKRFIHALGNDANADAIVVAILSLARNLKLEVTAEGVETEAQLAFLQKANCQLVQGYLLGRPGPRATVPNPALPRGQGLNLVPKRVPSRA